LFGGLRQGTFCASEGHRDLEKNDIIAQEIPIIKRTLKEACKTTLETIHRMIADLPSDLRQEAIHYIEDLARRKRKPAAKKFSLTWAGGLSHLKSSTTSVELQHKAHEWLG